MERSIVVGVFCYNRVGKLKLCIEALLENPECPFLDIIFFSDGFKGESDKVDVLAVRTYIDSVKGFKSVIKQFRDRNFSTGPNFQAGLMYLNTNYEEFIIVEDDLVVSPNYIKYLMDGLNFYKDERTVFCLTGYVFPIETNSYSYDSIVYKRFCSYGWAGWSNRLISVIWDGEQLKTLLNSSKKFKARLNNEGLDLGRMLKKQLSGEISTWDIQMQIHVAENCLKVIYPSLSKVLNIGFDSESTNTFGLNYLKTPLDSGTKRTFVFCPASLINLDLQSQIKRPYDLKALLLRKGVNELIKVVNVFKRVLLSK